jgi:CBS domain-containing protein
MQRDCARVESEVSVQDVVDDLLRTGRRCFVVVEGPNVVGLLTPHEIKGIPRDRWRELAVADAMRPLGQLQVVPPHATVTEALEVMVREDVHQLPVVSEGRLEGVISRGDVVGLLRTRQELGV